MKMVIIRHTSGEEYAVTLHDFRQKQVRDGKTYEELGFKAVSYEDGSPLPDPKPKAAEKVLEAPKAAEK